MSEQNLLFLVAFIILTTTLVTIVWQFVRSRRRRDDQERGPWWEGPWDDDQRS